MENTFIYPTAMSTVAIVGLGKIGLPLAVQCAQHSWRVIGCDADPYMVETINAGRTPLHEEPELAGEVALLVASGMLSATEDTSGAVRQASVVVVIVPVAIDAQHEANFVAIGAATVSIGTGLQPGTLVIYETPLPVGTTAQRFGPLLAGTAKLKVGCDFHLAYSHDCISSGHILRELPTYPKVVGGIDGSSTADTEAFYRSVLNTQVITMASTDEAEFVKLIETTHRDVNIALANEYTCYADAHGLNVATAIAAAKAQPYAHIHSTWSGHWGKLSPYLSPFSVQ